MPAAKSTYDTGEDRRGRGADDRHDLRTCSTPASAWPQLASKTIAEAIQRTSTCRHAEMDEEEQTFARDFQKSAERPVVGLRTTPAALGERQQATSSNDSGTSPGWCRPGS